MARLINCWFIIESIIIPDGFLKWFYLSFYIHPLLLLFCQIYLWLKLLKLWTLFFLAFIFKPIRLVILCIFQLLRYFAVFIFSYARTSNTANNVVKDTQTFDIIKSNSQNQIFAGSHSCLSFEFPRYECKPYKLEDIFPKGENQESIVSHRELTALPDEDREYFNSEGDPEDANTDLDYEEEYRSSLCSSSTLSRENDLDKAAEDCPFVEFLQFPSTDNGEKADVLNEIPSDDPFYSLYFQRMKWFDLVSYERSCGITAILKSELGFQNTFEGTKRIDLSNSLLHKPRSKSSRKRILKSIENDVEMVYVAQSCLSWEALHHQYVRVQDHLASCSTSHFTFLPNNIMDAFQKFQILLERFMEDDRSCEGTRYSNYVQARFSQKSLLQVPIVSEIMEEGMQDEKGEVMEARKVLKAIENCIKTFLVFVKTDNHKSCYKFKTSTYERVEDPRDLRLLANLTKKLHKHELWMKNLQGKKRCWLNLKRVASHTGEAQERREILFTLIDLGLVKRALKMSVISSSQLRWCQQKLDNIQYRDGKISRTTSNNCPLFPPS